jgi:hypothetical protein
MPIGDFAALMAIVARLRDGGLGVNIALADAREGAGIDAALTLGFGAGNALIAWLDDRLSGVDLRACALPASALGLCLFALLVFCIALPISETRQAVSRRIRDGRVAAVVETGRRRNLRVTRNPPNRRLQPQGRSRHDRDYRYHHVLATSGQCWLRPD